MTFCCYLHKGILNNCKISKFTLLFFAISVCVLYKILHFGPQPTERCFYLLDFLCYL